MRENGSGFKTAALTALMVFMTASFGFGNEQNGNEPEAELSIVGKAGEEKSEMPVFELEGFVVTGSLIPRSETAGEAIPIPVDIITSADIESSGFSTAAELLQNMSVSNGGNVPIANNATGFTPSASSVSLRGLPGTTLVLLNGRRVANFPTGAGGTGAFVDLNSIPLAAVERFEVLKDGAAATYGADAVAGVINIIFKSDFVGTQTSLRYGNTTADTDSSEFNFNAITGFSTGNTEFTLGANYFSRKAIFMRDRDYSADPPFRSTNASPINIDLGPESAYVALVDAGVDPNIAELQAQFSYNEQRAIDALLLSDLVDQAYIDARLPDGLPANQRFLRIRQDLNFLYGAIGGSIWTLGHEPILATSAPTYPDGSPVEAGIVTGFPGTETNLASNDGSVPAQNYLYAPNNIILQSRYNPALTAGAYPEIGRKGAFLTFDHRIKDVSIYGDINYQKVFSRSEAAPPPTGSFYTPGQTTIVIPANTDSPLLHPDDLATFGGRPAEEGAFNRFNPYNQDLSHGTRLRLFDFGNRVYENDNDAITLTLGAKTDDVADSGWNLDTGYRFSWIGEEQRSRVVSASRLNRILNENDPIFDPTSSEYIGTEIPYNPFGYWRNPIANNALLTPFATVETVSDSESSLHSADFLLNNPEVLSLPTGPVGMAIGGTWRREAVEQNLDPLITSGDIVGASSRGETDASQQVAGLFAEVDFMLVSPEQNFKGAYLAGLTLAGRYEEFITRDESTFVPKIGIRYMPYADLLFRATWQESYKDPSLFTLYSGASQSLQNVYNPRTGLRDEAYVTTTGNAELDAEDSESISIGAVFTPGFLPGFSVAVDYWRIKRDGVVVGDTAATVVRDFIGAARAGESVNYDSSNRIVAINTQYENSETYDVEGVDFDLGYIWETNNAGIFDFYARATYVMKYEIERAFEDSISTFDLVGRAATNDASFAFVEWRANFGLRWSYRSLFVNVNGNYIDGFSDENRERVGYEVDDSLLWNLNLSYEFFGDSDKWYRNTTLTIGIDNLFDQDPPYAEGGGNNTTGYPGFLYLPEGRFLWLEVKKKF